MNIANRKGAANRKSKNKPTGTRATVRGSLTPYHSNAERICFAVKIMGAERMDGHPTITVQRTGLRGEMINGVDTSERKAFSRGPSCKAPGMPSTFFSTFKCPATPQMGCPLLVSVRRGPQLQGTGHAVVLCTSIAR